MKRKVTNNDIRKAIRGVINEGHSSYMAKSQLYNIARKAQSMYDQLEKGEPLEDWMESNIAKMDNMMDSVSDAFSYDQHQERSCPDGMYWCNEDQICKPDSQDMSIMVSTQEMNEAIGFTKSYEGELKTHMDAFINIVCGYIKEQVSKKSMYGDEVIVQRLYQLLAEGGELHSPVQELIDIIDNLPNKDQGPMGFRIGQNY